MKILWMTFLILTHLPSSFAQEEVIELAIIKIIDDYDLPQSYSEASERALPEDYYYDLLKSINTFENTVLSDGRARDLFNQLKRNPKARMRVAGGRCSYRRRYIQDYLRRMDIDSGRLLIKCPARNGRLRMRDQVTGRRYTFINYHDTNVVSVRTNAGVSLKVMDVQFESGPLSLSRYLAKVEASQKIKPLRNRSAGDRGYCYWSVR